MDVSYLRNDYHFIGNCGIKIAEIIVCNCYMLYSANYYLLACGNMVVKILILIYLTMSKLVPLICKMGKFTVLFSTLPQYSFSLHIYGY